MSYSKIIKAKLLQNDEKVIVFHKRTNKDGSHSIIPGEETDYLPHPDLIARFQDLRMHLALKCAYTNVKTSRNPKTLEEFHVTGFSIFGKNDNGIIISGYRITEDGVVTLNAPRIWFESETSSYYFLEGLRIELEALIKELLAFLDGTKKGEHKSEPSSEKDSDNNDGDEEDDDDDDFGDDGPPKPTKPSPTKKKSAKKTGKSKATSKVKKNHLGQELSDISIPAK
jgi:hypothetical protein